QLFAFALDRLVCNERRLTGYGNLLELLQVLSNDQGWGARMACQNLLHQGALDRILCSDAEFFAREGRSVGHAHITGQSAAHLSAGCLSYPASSFQVTPGHIVLLWPNQTKDIAFPSILTHEGGGESQPTPRLDLGSDPKHRRRQQMYFIVDDQAPVALVEQ